MESVEIYWALASKVTELLSLIAEGWIFCFFVRPFLDRSGSAGISGMVYSVFMIILYLLPMEFDYPRIFSLCAMLAVMYLTDRRNRAQKLVLVMLLYLFQWIAHGVALVPRDICDTIMSDCLYMAEEIYAQLAGYIIVQLLFCVIRGILLYFLAAGMHKVYAGKQENISGKELLLLLCVLSVIMTGYFSFAYLSDVYEADMGRYIWYSHREYKVLKVMYQIFSCLVLFIAIGVYQKVKERQRKEKERVVLTEQMENMKMHIAEVERLYGDIRALKHEMGNHISVLENLILKSKREETEKYFSELKEKWRESVLEIKTGNPVTDVILMQKQKELQEKGIRFQCDFFYPQKTKLETFDVSVLLNNALVNALEGATGCSNPYVSVSAYRKKNAYMIEVRNSIRQKVVCSKGNGLPETTKKDKVNHGFGLAVIRAIAEKYYGTIEIEQDENSFLLSIMLMVE